MDVTSFSEIEEEFLRRVRRIVWCNVATVNRQNRPRSRVLHPIWTGPIGWITTRRHSFKAGHLAHNPYISLAYLDDKFEPVYVDCLAEWADDPAEKERIWELFKSTEPPLGYDPGTIWESPADSDFGLLKLTPWRLELASIADQVAGIPPKVWRG